MIAHDVVDLVIVVDDASQDETMKLAQGLDRVVAHRHPKNRGYGGNQKTCYQLALDHGADIVVMVHPDYQYTPKLIPAMAGMVSSGLYSCVLASRILGGGALEGGMPMWRYVANRFLTLFGNILLGTKVSEFHTGYRAYSRELLEALPLAANSDDFVFDNQVLAETVWLGFTDRRGVVPDELRAGRLVDQFRAQRSLRLRLPRHRGAVSAGQVGRGALGAFPARGTSPTAPGASARTERRTAAGTATTPRRPRRTPPDSAAASPSEMNTGNSTAVKRPTPSKPLGSDIAIDSSAQAVRPAPSVRAAISVRAIDNRQQRQVERAEQVARRPELLHAFRDAGAGEHRPLEEVIASRAVNAARPEARFHPTCRACRKAERIAVAPVVVGADHDRRNREDRHAGPLPS